ncbi:MAG TPA: class I SAM-dependent methyltransferase [Patescibacteria group bacterium]|nr:class I SAM-dependent methyltransferase [Patescibacteria group bacterium]
MKLSRNFSVKVLYVLDQWVPPIMRDSKWFMIVPLKLVLKHNARDFMTFKDWVFKSTDKEFGDLYERTALPQELQGETDLNEACLNEILKRVKGKRVLEVGCGRGLLADKLSAKNKVTGCDIVVSDTVRKNYPAVKFVAGNIENLPFKDKSFDVVVTTHTLEHVKDLPTAVKELRRIAKEELIIVVPKQRPYKYGFSLHTQFFPYEWSLQGAFGYIKGKTTIKNLDGDWFYRQKMQ